MATGFAAGTTNITATSGSIHGNASLTVNATTLTAIAVTPAATSINISETKQFAANGSYSNGSYRDITTSVTWASSNTSAATINASTGLATGFAAGTTNITATSGSIHGNASLTVNATTLTAIAVTPAATSINISETKQFAANGSYSNGSYRDITTSVTWGLKPNTSAASINSSTGLALGVAAGTTNISATSGQQLHSNNTSLTSEASLSAIKVTPASDYL